MADDEPARLGIVEWVGWNNHTRLHNRLGDIPPAEHENIYAPDNTLVAMLEST